MSDFKYTINISPEECAELARRYDNGEFPSTLAGRSKAIRAATIAAAKHGGAKRIPGQKETGVDPAFDARVYQLRERGMTTREVAETLDVSQNRVVNAWRREHIRVLEAKLA